MCAVVLVCVCVHVCGSVSVCESLRGVCVYTEVYIILYIEYICGFSYTVYYVHYILYIVH